MKEFVRLLLFAAAAALVRAHEELSAPVGYAPLYVSLVRFNEVPPLGEGGDPGVASQARPSGFPATPWLSRPPIPRATETSSLGAATPSLSGGSTFDITSANLSFLQAAGPQQSEETASASGSFISLGAAGAAAPAAAQLSFPEEAVDAAAGRRLSASRPTSALKATTSSAPATTRLGFQSLDGSQGTQGLAVGPTQAIHAAGAVMSVYTLESSTGLPSADGPRRVLLQTFFSTAADSCLGVYDPDATYDKTTNRFLLSATCGGEGRVLLAVSNSDDASGAWFVFGLVADAVSTSLACSTPKEAAMVDYTKLTYNSDGVFLSFFSYCPSNPMVQGAGLLALPKYALVKGMPNFFYAVYTSGEVAKALVVAGVQGLGASSCRQLQPVVPQTAKDIPAGSAAFVCEVLPGPTLASGPRRIALVSLADTGSLWQYGGPDSSTSSPVLAAQQLELRGQVRPEELLLAQPAAEGPRLAAGGGSPAGFWSGNAIRFKGRVYLTLRTNTKEKAGSPARPAVLWLQLAVNTTAAGTQLCPASTYGISAAKAFDWAKDYTAKWGSEWDKDWKQQPRTVAQIKAAAAAAGAAYVNVASAGDGQQQWQQQVLQPVVNEVTSSGNILMPNRIPPKGGVQVAKIDAGQACSCYDCYWGGSYLLFGGYTGGTVNQPGFGYAGFGWTAGYYQSQGGGFGGRYWQLGGGGGDNTCYIKCMRCWYYGYPGYGFGYTPSEVRVGGLLDAQVADIGQGAASVTAADFNRLLKACSRVAAVTASVLRLGVAAGSGSSMGLAFPVAHVTRNGSLVLMSAFSGPAKAPGDTSLLPGVAMSVLPLKPKATSSTFVVVRRGRTAVPTWALGPGSSWGDGSAMAYHPSNGRVYAAVRYAAGSSSGSPVGTWVGVWDTDQLDKLAPPA